MVRFILTCSSLLMLCSTSSAFTMPAARPTALTQRQSCLVKQRPTFVILSSTDGAADTDEEVVLQKAFPVGTLVEFEEKSRVHMGKIISVNHKANGKPRYDVEEYPSGDKFDVADKEISFSLPAPKSAKQADDLLEELDTAQSMPDEELNEELDISPELLAMAWEEVEDGEDDEREIKAKDLIELVHSTKADGIEKYEAWRLLKSEMGHVFFKEIKDKGRTVAFKAKGPSAVEASAEDFVATHDEVMDDGGFGDAVVLIDEDDAE